ncbi:MAG: GntR family transcriptional regulator [Oscillospiraceae bacterium]|nr:GntR family transcriptional regulator [Oscillospiraceae bacterium]
MDAKDIRSAEELREYLKIRTTTRGMPIYLPVYRKLRDLIVSGYYKKGDKMLPEAELAAMFGVGRTTLRTAFAILFEDGYLHTYQGKGTFVIYEPGHEERQRYPEFPMLPRQRLEDAGVEVSVLRKKLHQSDYDAFLDEKLKANGKPIDVFSVLFSADKKNIAILNTFYFISDMLKKIPRGDEDGLEAELERIFEEEVNCVNCTVSPVTGSLSSDYPISKQNCMLVSSRWMGFDNEPILYCKDYYNVDIIRFRAKFMK